jgi:hypothetical protein
MVSSGVYEDKKRRKSEEGEKNKARKCFEIELDGEEKRRT